MALSTYFATDSSIDYSAANSDLPILIQHGTHDPVVPVQLGERAYTLLKDKQYSVNYLTYPSFLNLTCYQLQKGLYPLNLISLLILSQNVKLAEIFDIHTPH